jgi:hypothetical protein
VYIAWRGFEMAVSNNFFESIRTNSLQEDVEKIYNCIQNRFNRDMKEPFRDENILRSHVSCLQIFEGDKYLNLLFGFILQYGYRSERKKSEIGLCILYWGEKRQIKLDILFNNIEGQELVHKWVNIVKQVQERRQSNSSASTSTSTTTNLATPGASIANTVAAAQPPTAGIRATKKARLEFMSPTMCYSCVVNCSISSSNSR